MRVVKDGESLARQTGLIDQRTALLHLFDRLERARQEYRRGDDRACGNLPLDRQPGADAELDETTPDVQPDPAVAALRKGAYDYITKPFVNEDLLQTVKNALRQRPDVILVGEIRDREVMEQELTAAETGHLVFGTLHTTGAAKTSSDRAMIAENFDAFLLLLTTQLKNQIPA